MPAQVDGARRDVDVHEVVHDTALDVVLNSVNQIPATNINYLDIGELPAWLKLLK